MVGSGKTPRMAAVAAILLVMGWTTAMGAVIHVDADASAGGDGADWGSAYKYLQDALLGQRIYAIAMASRNQR